MPPKIMVTTTSHELGLEPGDLPALDRELARLPREKLLLRTISLLHALNADREQDLRTINNSFVAAAPSDIATLVFNWLQKDNATFFEPFQQLLVLRRAMTVCTSTGECQIDSEPGFRAYFHACRFAGDLTAAKYEEDASDTRIEKWLKVAAGMMPRLPLTNPVNPNHWIARLRLMMERVPATQAHLQPYAEALKQRFPDAAGVSIDQAFAIVQFLSYWTLLPDLDAVFRTPEVIRFNPETWLKETKVPADALRAFLERTSRNWDEVLSDTELGGATSVLPFRDRPFVRFQDGTVAPVMRELILEKLTADVFWWLKRPDVPQDVLWQRDWGYLAEGYLLWILERLAADAGCEFKADVQWDDGQFDAAMWFKGHVALFEITTSSITGAVGMSGNWKSLRQGLHQAFVESKRGGMSKREAVLQLARDVEAVASGPVSGLLKTDKSGHSAELRVEGGSVFG